MLGCIEAEYVGVVEDDNNDYHFENFVRDYIEPDETDEEKLKVLDEHLKGVYEKIEEFEEYENTIEKLCRKLKCRPGQTDDYGEYIQKMMEFTCDMNNMKNKLKYKMAREKSWGK